MRQLNTSIKSLLATGWQKWQQHSDTHTQQMLDHDGLRVLIALLFIGLGVLTCCIFMVLGYLLLVLAGLREYFWPVILLIAFGGSWGIYFMLLGIQHMKSRTVEELRMRTVRTPTVVLIAVSVTTTGLGLIGVINFVSLAGTGTVVWYKIITPLFLFIGGGFSVFDVLKNWRRKRGC